MKILIISGSFYPVASPRSFRTTELAKELARQGHIIKVIFPDNLYNYSEWNKEYSKITLEPIKNIYWTEILLKGKGLSLFLRRLLKRLFSLLFDYPSISWYFKLPKILKSELHYDLLISIAVPHSIHWGVAHCIRKNIVVAKKWIADCGDPYMGCETDSFKKPFYFSFFEKSFCRKADFITIPTKASINGYYKEFHHKIRVIPQGFNYNEIELDNYVIKDKIRFCYAGSFILNIRDPRPILDALLNIESDFTFYVFTNNLNLICGYENKFQDKLVIRNYISRIELIKFMSTMDFLINIENGDAKVQVPSKLIDYSLSKRPILSLNSKNVNIDIFTQFFKRDYSNKTVVENIELYNIKNVANAFLNIN